VTDVVDDVIAFCRMFASFEREEICCGTVTQAQCVVLQALTEGEWDVSSLASYARVTKGAVTRLVDGLESRGWVVRRRGKDDARRVIIELSDDGRREAERLEQLTAKSIESVFNEIPKAERATVERSLHLLRQAAERTRDQLDCC
jgi:DNA-binding MarR family transcriptional regulator